MCRKVSVPAQVKASPLWVRLDTQLTVIELQLDMRCSEKKLLRYLRSAMGFW